MKYKKKIPVFDFVLEKEEKKLNNKENDDDK